MPPAVPSYAALKDELRLHLGAIGFKHRGRLYARRTPDTWEVLALDVPPKLQDERGAVRFVASLIVTVHRIRQYFAAWSRDDTDLDQPPQDSSGGWSIRLEPNPDSYAWRADSTTDPVKLAEHIMVEFERVGLPFLEANRSAETIRDRLLPTLSSPEPGAHSVVALAVLCRSMGPPEAYERAMGLLENFPGPATFRSWARDQWHMIPRYAGGPALQGPGVSSPRA